MVSKKKLIFFYIFIFFFQGGEGTMKKKDDDEHSFTGDDKSVSYSDDRCLKGSQRDGVVVEYQKRGQPHTHILSFQNEK